MMMMMRLMIVKICDHNCDDDDDDDCDSGDGDSGDSGDEKNETRGNNFEIFYRSKTFWNYEFFFLFLFFDFDHRVAVFFWLFLC